MPLIVLDAIDGAGKSTVMRGIADYFRAKNLRVFDLVPFTKQFGLLPEHDDPELKDADVLLSAEPTYCWVGRAIRDDLIKNHPNRTYDGHVVAQAFSIDRLELFSRVILPFLNARPDRWVIQDRGTITSLAYQTVQDPAITPEWLMTLEGNRLELTRPPDLLLLLRLAPETALRRLSGRAEKNDGAVFENATFQERVAAQYRNPAVLKPYADAGTRIVEIDATQPPEEVIRDAIREIEAISPPNEPQPPTP